MKRLIGWFKQVRVDDDDTDRQAFFSFHMGTAWWWGFGWRLFGLLLAAGQLASGFGVASRSTAVTAGETVVLAAGAGLTILHAIREHPDDDGCYPLPFYEPLGIVVGIVMMYNGLFLGGLTFIIGSLISGAVYARPKHIRRLTVELPVVILFDVATWLEALRWTDHDTFWSLGLTAIFMAGLECGLSAAHRWDEGWVSAWMQEYRRQRELELNSLTESLSTYLTRFVHDSLLPILQRAGAGQPVDEGDRETLIKEAHFFRRHLLGDVTEPWAGDLIDRAVEQAASLHIALRYVDNVTGKPPAGILLAFEDALGALIANLPHAKVPEARLTLDAGDDYMHVTLVDDGIGMEQPYRLSSSTFDRVFEHIDIGVLAVVLSSPGGGTTWKLSWTRGGTS
jgi:hypothetical protein